MIYKWDKSVPPSGAFTLNRDCPQAQGLVAWWPVFNSRPAFLLDGAGGTYNQVPGTAPSMSIGQLNEPVMTYAGGSSQFLNCLTTPVIGKPLTLWTRFKATASGSQVLMTLSDGVADAGTDGRYLLYLTGTGPLNANFQQRNAGGSANVATSSNTIAVGASGVAIARAVAAAVPRVSLEGVNTSGTGTDQNPTVSRIAFGYLVGSPSLFLTGDIGESGLHNIDISDEAAYRLYSPDTRYELMYPLRSPKWISLPAVGGSLITKRFGIFQAVNRAASF